jgi:hypothetical protein
MKGNKTGVDADAGLLLDLEYTCTVCEHTCAPETTHTQTEDMRTRIRASAHTHTRARLLCGVSHVSPPSTQTADVSGYATAGAQEALGMLQKATGDGTARATNQVWMTA